MKKILAIIAILGILLMPIDSIKAQSSEPNFWRKTDDAIYLKKDTWTLGDVTNKISKIWAEYLHVGTVVIDTIVDGFLHVQTTSTSAFLIGDDVTTDMLKVDTTNGFIYLNKPLGADLDVGGMATITLVTGDITTEGYIQVENGTAVAPSMSFTSDINTGIFRLSADELSLGAGGTEGLRIDFNELEVQPMMTLSTGNIEVEEDAGAVTLVNLSVSATPADNTIESYSFAIDSNIVLTVYGQANSSGGSDEHRIGIATTTPATLMDVFSTGTTTITIDSNSATQGACLKLKDSDGGGYSYITILDGTITATTTSCE